MATYFLKQIFPAGFRLLGGETATKAVAEPPWSQGDGFVALASGGQTGATQLFGTIARVSTVANAADSVMLPASNGQPIVVINGDTNSMQVFGQAGDTINGVATGTGVAQAAGKTALYVSPAPGVWFRLLSS